MNHISRHYSIISILVVLTVLLSACRPAPRPQPQPPQAPPPSPATIVPATVEPMNIISVRLDEVRLTERAGNRQIDVDTIWMIPLNAYDTPERGQGARFQYVEEGRLVSILPMQPYNPTSPWFISVDKADLDERDFGMWFVITASGNGGELLMNEFTGFLGEAAITVAAGGATVLLAASPIPGDEVAAGAITASRGRAMIGRVLALGSRAGDILGRTLREQFPALAVSAGGYVNNVIGASQSALRMDYFGEVVVLFPYSDNYNLNTRITAETTDGTLELVFSVIESRTATDVNDVVTSSFSELDLPAQRCNPNLESTMLSGQAARVNTPRLTIYEDPIDPQVDKQLRILSRGDVVVPIVPYCNAANQSLWWTVCVEEGCGWVAEYDTANIFLVPEEVTE